jgi:phage gp36-like protein
MSYIVQSDLLSQVSEEQLVQLTDDPKIGIVDTARVTAAIANAEAEIDGYVATRYAVPLAAPVPALIKTLSIDVAIYHLWRRRQKVPDLVRTAYEDAVKKLEAIAKGTITLGVDPPPAESSKGTAGETFGPDRVFDRDKMGSF